MRRCTACHTPRVDTRTNTLNDLDGAAWARGSRSVETYPDRRSAKQKRHGASFPQSLAAQQIELYTQRGQTVLDPFLGVGTTLDAAHALGRRGIGIERHPPFLDAARADLPDDGTQVLHAGDCRQILPTLPDNAAHLVVTSPPYGNLLRHVKPTFGTQGAAPQGHSSGRNPAPYSDAEDDLGNLDNASYLQAMKQILGDLRRVVIDDGYAVLVVKDYRDLERGVPLVPLHAHLITLAPQAGWTVWDLRIWDQARYRSLVCLGYPSRNLYLNLGHSYLLVLRNLPQTLSVEP